MVVGLQHVIVHPGRKVWLSGVVVLQVIVHVVGIGTSIEFVVMRLNVVMATVVFVMIEVKTWVMSLIGIVMMAWVLLVGYSMAVVKTLTGTAIVAMLWVMIVILALIVAVRVHDAARL